MDERREHLKKLERERTQEVDPLKGVDKVDKEKELEEIRELEMALMWRDQEIGRLQSKIETRGQELMSVLKKKGQLEMKSRGQDPHA